MAMGTKVSLIHIFSLTLKNKRFGMDFKENNIWAGAGIVLCALGGGAMLMGAVAGGAFALGTGALMILCAVVGALWNDE